MQTVTAHELQGAPVWTRLGERVGRVHDLTLETDTGRMAAIHVRLGHWVPLAIPKTIVVPWSHIVLMTPEKVVIDDAVVTELSLAVEPRTAPFAPTPV